MTEVLITGAGGFLGRNLVEALARQGCRVIACDISCPPTSLQTSGSHPSNVHWRELDVSREESWREMTCKPDIVISAAAITPGDDDPDPPRTAEVNLMGCLRALHWAKSRGVHRFIFTSSSAVYRGIRTDRDVLDEDLPVDPPTSYGKSKVAAEKFVNLYSDRGQMGEAFSVRLPSLYGPWERPTGVRPNMSAVYSLVRAAHGGYPLRVSRTGAARDWTYAPDAAAAIGHLALRSEPTDVPVINVSTGRFVYPEEIVTVLQNEYPEHDIKMVPDAASADVHITPTSGERPMRVERLARLQYQIDDPPTHSLRHYARWVADYPEMLDLR